MEENLIQAHIKTLKTLNQVQVASHLPLLTLKSSDYSDGSFQDLIHDSGYIPFHSARLLF